MQLGKRTQAESKEQIAMILLYTARHRLNLSQSAYIYIYICIYTYIYLYIYIYPPPGLAPDGCVYNALDCQPAASCQYCRYCSIIRGQQIGYLRLLASTC